MEGRSVRYEIYLKREQLRNVVLVVDQETWTLQVFNEKNIRIPCALGPAEVRVLQQLLSSPGEVFSKEELITAGWVGRVVAAGSLTQAIFNIRTFLGVDGHCIIVTSPKTGYLFSHEFVVGQAATEGVLINNEVAVPAAPQVASTLEANIDKRAKSTRKTNYLSPLGWTVAALLVVTTTLAIALMKPEIDLVWNDPVNIESRELGQLELKFISAGAQVDSRRIDSQMVGLSPGLVGEVWVRAYERRYRVVCFSDEGASSYTASRQMPLKEVIAQCVKREVP